MGKVTRQNTYYVCFYGEAPFADPVVAAVVLAQKMTLRANLARAVAADCFTRYILVTDASDLLANSPPETEVIATNSLLHGEEWHFGRALRAVASRLAVDDPHASLAYIGGGVGPLLKSMDLAALCDILPDAPIALAANNYFSADLVLVRPLSLLLDPRAESIHSDNDLPWRLDHDWPDFHEKRQYATLAAQASTFDLDTPLDAALLMLAVQHGLVPDDDPGARYIRAFAADAQAQAVLAPLVSQSEQVRTLLTVPRRHLLIAGRLNGTTLRLVEQRTLCQTRAIAEERGMRASGREERGEVQSLLGALYDAAGPERFFAHIRAMADAVIIDSRVLFAHWQRHPSMPDRFHSDLLDATTIHDPVIRAFTEAAAQVAGDVPLLFGGHSAVAGGLRLLLEML